MKIVTYNIHSGMDSNNKITLNKIGKYLKNLECDIICLQEVLYPQFVKLKLNLKMNGVFAANVEKATFSYGICTFSKQDINNSDHVLLPSKKEQRGFLCINVGTNRFNTNIINTHLGLDKYERYNQISEILDYTKTLVGDAIICGDFNEKNIYLSKFTNMAIDFREYDKPTFEKSKARIDYIFINHRLYGKEYYVDQINLSDHYPVIGII